MQPQYPQPGDLIRVEKSEWYALKDGERLRVCEQTPWIEQGWNIYVAPRLAVSTFWGPSFGPPDRLKPEIMSTSGGPFQTVALSKLEGLEFLGSTIDSFWCWQDWPRAGGGIDRIETVSLWQCRLLVDDHYRNCSEYQVKERGS